MAEVRLRQLVFASHDASDIETLQQVLGLQTPFADPGVAEFGLSNGVFALGDQFLEIVVPTQPGTAAGRFIDRSGGQGGYMAIFQTDDLAGVRARADAASIRRVWNVDLPDIDASHMHPADIGAAIVSVDEPRPPASWRWGGPDWTARAAPGAILGAELTSPDPEKLATRWASLLGIACQKIGDGWQLSLAGGTISVRSGDTDRLSAFHIRVPSPDEALKRAASAGLATSAGSFHAMGVKVCLKPD